jgi:putative ABC transport system permease protein
MSHTAMSESAMSDVPVSKLESSGSGRRPVVRWALRLLRREWRQHALVIVLLTVAVAGALFATTVAYNVGSDPAAEFGNATHRFMIDRGDPAGSQTLIDDASSSFEGAEVVGETFVPIPGSAELLTVRAQDPSAPLGEPMLELVDGRFPGPRAEVALTDGLASMLDVTTGDTVEVGGRAATVVGLVRNPFDFGDEFALDAPAAADRFDQVIVLIRTDDGTLDEFLQRHSDGHRFGVWERHDSDFRAAALVMLVASTLAMLLVSLVAGAAFTVIAQRRQRQLGMLAAIGATPSRIKLVMLADGAAVGVVAGVIGVVVGLGAWALTSGPIEAAAGHEIAPSNVPWWIVAAAVALALVASLGASWWPARTASRLPVMSAISARPPQPRPARHSALLGVVLLAAGIITLILAVNPDKDSANFPMVLGGTIASTAGLVLLAPAAVRALALVGRRSPLASRIAVRDLRRHQARSGAALAAITLGLAIAVTIVVVAAAVEDGAAEGNLASSQLLIRVGNSELETAEIGADELDSMRAAVEGIASQHGGTQVVSLEVAVDPTESMTIGSRTARPTVFVGWRVDEDTYRDAGVAYVATPELLAYLGIERTSIEPDAVLLSSVPHDDLYFVNVADPGHGRDPIAGVHRIPRADHSSVPRSMITQRGLDASGWPSLTAGWLLDAEQPFTDTELVSIREIAATAGVTVESRDEQGGLETLRTSATVSGIGLALAILAMAVGLIRTEAANDVRNLTAVGASSRTRRAITATTAGALALLAVVLGMAGAYGALIAGYTPAVDRLGNVPIRHLAAIGVGLPILATAAGWLLAGRQPRHIARRLGE